MRLWPFGYKRVLLLEDDTSMQRLVRLLLRSDRARVEIFGNGRDVIARIQTHGERYDAFLLDLMMPHDGGLSVLRDLRDHHPELLGRVILLTASGTGITDKWLPLVFDVVHKPFEAAALLNTVRACAAQSESD